LKYLIIATLAGIFLVIVYSRLRPYIQLVRKVLKVIGGSAGSNSSVSSQSRKATVNAEHKLIRCVSCGTWIPADRAITLNAGAYFERAQISGNSLYRRMWRAVYSAVKQGKKISAPLNKSPLLPRSVVQMIGAGEESGKLGEVLDEVAEYYSKELRQVIKGVTAMIEPLMIVLMGSIVGFIAMSIILPIFKLSQLVK